MKESKSITTIFNNNDGYDFEDAKVNCIERHLEEYPEDRDWQPSDEEVFEEIDSCYDVSWDETERDLENFFNNGDVFILTGFAETWRGNKSGGAVIENYSQLTKAWNDCDYLRIYDKLGEFNISATHHDGTNCWTVRRLTNKGKKYLENHKYDNPRELHETLFGPGYSVNLHYAKKVYGC